MTASGEGSGDHSTRRIAWLDAARGIGIILVVYGHALAGLVESGFLPGEGWTRWHHVALYGFHMPLFFLLSGLTFGRTLQRSPRQFLSDRMIALVYPYILWSIAQSLLSMAAAGHANNAVSMQEILNIWWNPISQFWFLYALLLCHLAGWLIGGRRWLLVAGALFGTFGFWLADASMIERACKMFPFFAAGILIAGPLLAAPPGRREPLLAAAALLLYLGWLLAFSDPSLTPVIRRPLAVAAGLCGIAFTLVLARRIGGASPLLLRLGAASMAIFVLHTMISAAVRIAFKVAGIDAPILCLVVATLAGLALPLFAYEWASRRGLSQLLGFGRGDARKTRPAMVVPA